MQGEIKFECPIQLNEDALGFIEAYKKKIQDIPSSRTGCFEILIHAIC